MTNISKQDASRIMRVMVRLQSQIDRASQEKRYADADAMSKMYGRLQYAQFESSMFMEL